LKHSEESKQNLKNKIVGSQVLPEKFIDKLADKYNLSKKIAECSNLELKEIADNLKKFKLKITGNLGYEKAEVTRGGVDTNSLDSKTMMAKDFPGLYFIGEVVDVTGWLGGYNFQWAWASAYAAASSL
ncbi:MAG: NAD(P)/FAD-dependent oxidoreductase, partial [Candidatus Caenarcaniphilales bacterium]|jgi:hypothetical protein|nr:NAD(P)/FAD-dependent oxidoreductase [Candidatus Caenarcaniphilales bacterium]